jgi:hypothetical protein
MPYLLPAIQEARETADLNIGSTDKDDPLAESRIPYFTKEQLRDELRALGFKPKNEGVEFFMLAVRAKVSPSTIWKMTMGRSEFTSVWVADNILTALGHQHAWLTDPVLRACRPELDDPEYVIPTRETVAKAARARQAEAARKRKAERRLVA